MIGLGLGLGFINTPRGTRTIYNQSRSTNHRSSSHTKRNLPSWLKYKQQSLQLLIMNTSSIQILSSKLTTWNEMCTLWRTILHNHLGIVRCYDDSNAFEEELSGFLFVEIRPYTWACQPCYFVIIR